MKLNPDILRDILLKMEDAGYLEELSPASLYSSLNYSEEDINYSILKLSEAGFIKAVITNYGNTPQISALCDITYQGHQFLTDIRSDNVWGKTKQVLSKIGTTSVSSISQVASGILGIIIKQELGLI